MPLNAPALNLLRSFNPGLVDSFQLDWEGEIPQFSQQHPLALEIAALEAGHPSSLPYTRQGKTNWITFGGDLSNLNATIEDIRAWLIPSFAWELTPPFVTPSKAEGQIGKLIAQFSTAGYYRWACHSVDAVAVVRKLRQRRQVIGERPPVGAERAPSLYELRRKFQTALTVGDAAAAQEAIRLIDAFQLDSALNTTQMKLRLFATFGDDVAITKIVENGLLQNLALPNAIANSVVRAFSRTYLAQLEAEGKLEAAAAIYNASVHGVLANIALSIQVPNSIEAYRALAYRAWADRDEGMFRSAPLQEHLGDPVIAYLAGKAEAKKTKPEKDAEVPRTVIAIGPAQSVAEQFNRWTSAVSAVRNGNEAWIRNSIADLCDPESLLIPEEAERCALAMLELFTDADVVQNPRARGLAEDLLVGVAETLLLDVGAPRRQLEGTYKAVFEIWAEQRRESLFPPDGQLLLALAEVLLSIGSGQEGEVVLRVSQWWEARPVTVRLGWLVEGLDLLTRYLKDFQSITNLWIEGAQLLKRDRPDLSPIERDLWKRLGNQLGLPESSISDYLRVPDPQPAEQQDPLMVLGLKKIAIVTLQERPGRIAADLLGDRTKAEVQLVTSTAADGATRAASKADLILIVWSAIKHATFRGFDKVRDRVEYVQGTGPSSIVLAAERWAAKRRRGLAAAPTV